MLRRRLLKISAALLVLLIGVLSFFIATFDPDHYRKTLQDSLTEALGRPVRMTAAKLSLRRGPALAFSDLQVGTPGENGFLAADHLLLRLEWNALLQGEVVFSRILLEAPLLHLVFQPGTPDSRTLSAPQIPESAAIRSLAVEKGRILLEDRRDPLHHWKAELNEIIGEVSDLSAGAEGWLRLRGGLRLGEHESPVTLVGGITLPSHPLSWPQLQVAMGMILEDFHPAELLERYAPLPDGVLDGKTRLELTLEGAPESGLLARVRLPKGDLTYFRENRPPLPVTPMEASALWTHSHQRQVFSGISLNTPHLRLDGDAEWLRQDGVEKVQFRFDTPPLPLPPLLDHLPPGLSFLKERVTAGRVQIRNLAYEGPAGDLRAPRFWLPRLRGEIVFAGGALHLTDTVQGEGIDLTCRMEEDSLLFEEGTVFFLGTPLHLSGTVQSPFSDPRLLVQARGEIETDALLPLLPESLQNDLRLRGKIAAVADLTAEEEIVRLDVDADLTHLAGEWKSGVRKEPGQSGTLFLTLESKAERFVLNHAHLRLPPLEARARGEMSRLGEEEFDLVFDLSVPDMEKGRSLFPLLEKVEAVGAVDLHYQLSGTRKTVLEKRGTVSLHDFGLSPGVVAEIRQANGIIRLEGDRAQAQRLTARLGTSPMMVEGSLEDFSHPRLDLRVKGRSVRADETIFPTDRAMLRDVEGRLVIERDRVAFTPVSVRLDGGTFAVVEGEVTDFSAPKVRLDIHAPQGNIDEVIALWQRPQARREHPEGEDGRKTTVRITARVDEGRLGNLRFEKAEGLITWTEGTLSIHPLQFRAGEGRCTGAVVLEGNSAGSLLRVSGHLENFDAAKIYRDLLNRRGLVSGTLRGDFHLEGRLGDDFLSTSRGGASLEINRGVLHRFNSLATVFSLLNVSQILSLKLPDIHREGMPFNRLSAAVDLNQGVLRTEDLLVDSHAMNMSVVGNMDLVVNRLDLVLAIRPLQTVDKIVTRIPLAGWILTGDEKTLVTAHFLVRGPSEDPEVTPVPIASLSEAMVGILRRALNLPGRLIGNLGDFVRGAEE